MLELPHYSQSYDMLAPLSSSIRGRVRPGRRQPVAVGVQTSAPWRLSRSVIKSAGPAGGEFVPNADYAHVEWWDLVEVLPRRLPSSGVLLRADDAAGHARNPYPAAFFAGAPLAMMAAAKAWIPAFSSTAARWLT